MEDTDAIIKYCLNVTTRISAAFPLSIKPAKFRLTVTSNNMNIPSLVTKKLLIYYTCTVSRILVPI